MLRLLGVVLALYVLGFLVFVWSLSGYRPDLAHVDGIVALTGGGERLDAAVTLFEHGVGKRLLISGVHPGTTRAELRAQVPAGPRFDCCTDLGYAAEDTHGNAGETAAWARFHHFRKLVVVTARYHMPRSLYEFHTVMPDIVLTPYPVDPEAVNPDRLKHSLRAFRILNSEFVKYLAVRAVTALRLKPGGLDPDVRHG